MNDNRTPTVVVIGAGISGLSAAHFVKKQAVERGLSVRVVVLEKDNKPGGKFATLREGGYTVEGGPNGFLDSKPWTLDLVRQLGMEKELLPSDQSAARRFIYSHGKLNELSASPIAFFRSNLMSIRGRIRIIGELWAKPTPKGQDTTLAEFATRRLGREALERLLDPMVSGIFAGDPERMSLRACFPRIAELEENYGGLVRAMMAIAKEKKKAKKRGDAVTQSSGPSGPGGVLTSFRLGVNQLTDRLAADLGPDLRLGEGVVSIQKNGSGFTVATKSGVVKATAVILAVPSDEAATILQTCAPDMFPTLIAIPYSPMAVVGLGYESRSLKSPPVGFGYLIPGVEKRRILGALWDTSIFPGARSPKDGFLIRVMAGGAKDPVTPRLPDDELIAAVRSELSDTMGLTATPSFVRIFRWDRAIPLYTVGHLDRVAGVETALPKGLVLAGNAYRGVGINDCVREAEAAARKAVESLGAGNSD